MLVTISLISGMPGLAQAQPGNALADTAVSQDIKTLFSLAGQLYPAFASSNGSGWFSFSGYTYKFFAASGVYAGVKDGTVYLMGGPYGNSPTVAGSLSAVTSSLQATISQAASAGADFANIAGVKTTYDLPQLFEELTVEWLIAGVTSQLKMERQGVESVAGTSTEKLKLTVTGSNLTSPIVSEMWVDSTGTVKRYIQNGFEYPSNQAQLIGHSLVSGLLLTMAATDTTLIRGSITNEIKNPALASKLTKKSIAGGSYNNFSITVGLTTSLHYIIDVTDLGNVTMVTKYDSKIGSTLNSSLQIISMRLRQ